MKSIAQAVRYFNEFPDIYTEEQFMDNFIYLTTPNRGEYISKNRLRSSYFNRDFGTIVKRYDPTLFHVSRSE